jgi:hypothetical protein
MAFTAAALVTGPVRRPSAKDIDRDSSRELESIESGSQRPYAKTGGTLSVTTSVFTEFAMKHSSCDL